MTNMEPSNTLRVFDTVTLPSNTTAIFIRRFGVSRSLFLDAHNRWKHKMLEKDRKKELYKTLGIKKVVKAVARRCCSGPDSHCVMENEMKDITSV